MTIVPPEVSRRLRGRAERLAYSALVRTIGFRQYVPGRTALEPELLIVGAQRSGTTSLQKYLQQHPAFVPPVRKEIHYFDQHFDRGEQWYFSHFPARRDGIFTADATPYYLFHPLAAQRAGDLLPEARIIALLRDPVERARSQHQHETAKGYEHLDLEAALDAEPQRLAGEMERIISDPSYQSFSHQHHAYLSRGRYLDQLLVWEKVYGPDRVLTITSEDFFADPQSILDQVVDFVEAERFELRDAKVHNSYRRQATSTPVMDRMAAEVDEDNQRLYDHLGRDLGWRRPSR